MDLQIIINKFIISNMGDCITSCIKRKCHKIEQKNTGICYSE